MKAKTKIICTEEFQVFVLKDYMNKIPIQRRLGISWKGCYYIIHKGESITYLRDNMYDLSYFQLDNGAEFKMDFGNPNLILEKGFKILT